MNINDRDEQCKRAAAGLGMTPAQFTSRARDSLDFLGMYTPAVYNALVSMYHAGYAAALNDEEASLKNALEGK